MARDWPPVSRAIGGLALFSGAGGAVVGLAITVPGSLAFGIVPEALQLAVVVLQWAVGGFLWGAVFGIAMAAMDPSRPSLPAVAALGFLAGVLIPLGALLVGTGPGFLYLGHGTILSSTGLGGCVGGVTAVVLVLVARLARSRTAVPHVVRDFLAGPASF